MWSWALLSWRDFQCYNDGCNPGRSTVLFDQLAVNDYSKMDQQGHMFTSGSEFECFASRI